MDIQDEIVSKLSNLGYNSKKVKITMGPNIPIINTSGEYLTKLF